MGRGFSKVAAFRYGVVVSQPLAALGLIALLMLAGCAQRDSSSRDERQGGFYGGIGGGMTRDGM